jgi:hypothetical protein
MASPVRVVPPTAGIYPSRQADLGARPFGPGQIVDFVRKLQDEKGLNFLFIPHDREVPVRLATGSW